MKDVRSALSALGIRRSPEIIRSSPRVRSRLAALTFDDGPSIWTPPILDSLRDHGARATFFVLGASVRGREELLGRILAEGHEIGNHTLSHLDPAKASDEVLAEEIRRGGEVIAAACGRRPALVRPPYGGDAERFAAVARRTGVGPTVLWSVDPADWNSSEAGAIVEHVLQELRPGAIVDLHDGMPDNSSGAPSRQATVDAVAQILPELAARGYRSVTVSELIAAR
jgi:peptidoglycan/xylan/chitin deacetylase (PgdA/CDA1 family)